MRPRHVIPFAIFCLSAFGCGKRSPPNPVEALEHERVKLRDAQLTAEDALASANEVTRNLQTSIALIEDRANAKNAEIVAIAAQPCDYLAAHPADLTKPESVPGVEDAAINSSEKVEMAVDACLEAIETYPDEPRFYFELGRVLVLAGLYEEGREYLVRAADMGHAAANYYLGRLENDPQKAGLYYAEAAETGFQPAQQALSEDSPIEERTSSNDQPAAIDGLPLHSQRVIKLSWSALGDWSKVSFTDREAISYHVNSLISSGAQVLVCSYGNPATPDWETYYFWYKESPKSLRDMVAGVRSHPLRRLGFRAIEKAPTSSVEAQRLKQEFSEE